ncbi:hypothetical protein CH330_01380 [candidate division WOR-3 bacterium JGI_Cruoil_03_51_56]|uniref:Uncharacterized protein n=1 Tax=candidate division WOR-3 bacterium JGI_Cruoil_03_51_56 TaxID=1973747 RepID=A0A235BX73_UNCW3|nr:MAG: hypothetical protein CH330_01380 [candidate division WOR-3 bacterium JGI_Cruoil_03_51_56]
MMAGEEIEGYTKVVQKEYNKAFHEFQDARISNANVRFSGDIEVNKDGTITTVIVPAGQQLRLVYLNFWLKEGTGKLIITQTGGTSHLLPAGQVDCLDNPTRILANLKDPIHVLEGTVTFKIEDVAYEGAIGSLSFWGDSNSPQIDP